MKSICHCRILSPLEPRNWRVAWANLEESASSVFSNLKRYESMVFGQKSNQAKKSTILKL